MSFLLLLAKSYGKSSTPRLIDPFQLGEILPSGGPIHRELPALQAHGHVGRPGSPPFAIGKPLDTRQSRPESRFR